MSNQMGMDPGQGGNQHSQSMSRRRFIASLGVAGISMAAVSSRFLPEIAEASGGNVFSVADYNSVEETVSAANAAGGGTVLIPPGNYMINKTMNISTPIYIIGTGTGNITSNPNGTGYGSTTLLWNGPAGATMFYFKAATADKYLYGGGIERCVIRGMNKLGTAIRGSSVGLMRFATLEVREVLTAGILLDAENGVLNSFNIIDDYTFIYGATSSVENANGIILRGNLSAGVTQNHIINVRGLIHHGHMLRIEWSDNNVIEKLFGVATGKGKVLYLANGVGGHAFHNFIQYMVGKVHAESMTAGNRIVHLISEGSNLSVDPGAQIHYEVEDYVRSALYTTHKFMMTDTLEIPSSSVAVMDGASSGTASHWPCIDMPDHRLSAVGIVIPDVKTWDNGKITTLTVKFAMEENNTTGKAFRATVKALSCASGSNIGIPKKETTVLVDVPTGVNRLSTVDIPLDLLYQLKDSLLIRLERDGAHADDTATGTVKLLGFEINYVGIGPYSPGSGTYAVTQPYV